MPISLVEGPMTWVFTGDSITQAVYHTHGARGWVEHCAERIRGQLRRLEDVVIDTGMSGWTAPEVLARYDHLVGRFAPDVVSIALGTNDAARAKGVTVAAYEEALAELARRAAAGGAQVVVHTPAPIADCATQERPDLPAYAEAARRVAQAAGAVLVDHERAWAEQYAARGAGQTEPIAWLDDWIHPNAEGHRVMADTALTAMGLGALERFTR